MKRFLARSVAAGAAAAMTLSLAACGGGSSNNESSGEEGSSNELVMACWNLSSAPEWEALVNAFEAKNSDIKIKLQDYSAKDYDTLLTTDLSAGKGPDIFPVKNMRKFNYYHEGGQLGDVSDIAKTYESDDNIRLDYFDIDGAYYGLPFRQDGEVIYYNIDLFKKAGVDLPDGNWTWDDYVRISDELNKGLAAAGETNIKGSYTHIWAIFQGFAYAQAKNPGIMKGDLSYLKPFYETALKLQQDGSVENFSTVQSQSLTYQAQFGTQKAAMMPMGTWYIGTLIQQQASGEADKFEWGMATVPQVDATTFDKPVTYGMSTPLTFNPALSGDKLEAAKKFIEFASSEEAALALVAVGVTPAYMSETVLDKFFAAEGMPQDELSRKALADQIVNPEFPIAPKGNDILTVLQDAHSAIMTETASIDDELKRAEEQLKAEGLVQ